MNRIKQIQIIEATYGKPYVIFRDEFDVENHLRGKQYRPGLITYEVLRRVARNMVADIDLADGCTVLTRREDTTQLAAATRQAEALAAKLAKARELIGDLTEVVGWGVTPDAQHTEAQE